MKRNNLKGAKPNRQEAERSGCTHDDVLTTHIYNISELYRRFDIDATRLFNLDETGMSPGIDCHGVTRKKGLVPRAYRCHTTSADFSTNLSRLSLLECVNAPGESILPLRIFKENRLPYRVRRLSNRLLVTDSATSMLPPDSLVGTRPEEGGIDTKIFTSSCKEFVKRVHYLTVGGKKILLVCDALRAQMSLPYLKILRYDPVEVYAIPAQTSGTTQPLDFGVYSAFKHYINEHLHTPSASQSCLICVLLSQLDVTVRLVVRIN